MISCGKVRMSSGQLTTMYLLAQQQNNSVKYQIEINTNRDKSRQRSISSQGLVWVTKYLLSPFLDE